MVQFSLKRHLLPPSSSSQCVLVDQFINKKIIFYNSDDKLIIYVRSEHTLFLRIYLVFSV